MSAGIYPSEFLSWNDQQITLWPGKKLPQCNLKREDNYFLAHYNDYV